MIDYFSLVFFGVAIAFWVQRASYYYDSVSICKKNRFDVRFLLLCLGCWIVFFSGLRTTYNDTVTYLQIIAATDGSSVTWAELLQPYGGFNASIKLVKRFVSTNPQMYIFLSAAAFNILYLRFLEKYSTTFGASLYLYFIGTFMFGCAGIKQALSMAIAIYAIEAFFEHKPIKALLILVIAMSFHPYIIVLVSIIALDKKVWDVRTMLLLVVLFVLFLNMDVVFQLVAVVGQDYSDIGKTESYTINPIRVLIEAVPIIISFLGKNRINDSGDRLVILGCNMSIIGFLFIFVGLFVNPIYPARMAAYFGCLSVVTTPRMLQLVFDEEKGQRIAIAGYYCLITAYFLLDLTKLGTIPLMQDRFNHASIMVLFQR